MSPSQGLTNTPPPPLKTKIDWPDRWQPSRQRSSASYRATCCPRTHRRSARSGRGLAHRKTLSHHNDSSKEKETEGWQGGLLGYTVNWFIHFVQNVWIHLLGGLPRDLDYNAGNWRGQGATSRLLFWCILKSWWTSRHESSRWTIAGTRRYGLRSPSSHHGPRHPWETKGLLTPYVSQMVGVDFRSSFGTCGWAKRLSSTCCPAWFNQGVWLVNVD